jgi:hypothetical protein
VTEDYAIPGLEEQRLTFETNPSTIQELEKFLVREARIPPSSARAGFVLANIILVS